MYMFLMRDEKEGRKKQARSNKQQGKLSNTAHPRQSHEHVVKFVALPIWHIWLGLHSSELPAVAQSVEHQTLVQILSKAVQFFFNNSLFQMCAFALPLVYMYMMS